MYEFESRWTGGMKSRWTDYLDEPTLPHKMNRWHQNSLILNWTPPYPGITWGWLILHFPRSKYLKTASSPSCLVMTLSLFASISKKVSNKFSIPYTCSIYSKQSDFWISSKVSPLLSRSQTSNVSDIGSKMTSIHKKISNTFLKCYKNLPERFGMMQMEKMKSLKTNILVILSSVEVLLTGL